MILPWHDQYDDQYPPSSTFGVEAASGILPAGGKSPVLSASEAEIGSSNLLRGLAWRAETAEYLSTIVEGSLCRPLDNASGFELVDQLRSIGGPLKFASAEAGFLNAGAQEVAERLSIESGARILLSTQVRDVVDLPGHVRIETSAGMFEADHAILALPPQLIPPLTGGRAKGDDIRAAMLRGAVIKSHALYETDTMVARAWGRG